MTRFAHAVREELWSRGRLIESRLSHGEAFEDEHGIVATDTRDDALAAAAERELDRLRAVMPGGFTVRLVAESSTEGTTGTITVRTDTLSLVTDPAHIREDVDLLHRSAASRSAGFQPAGPPASSRPVPLLWLNGSASVLLHELLGHPLEHGRESPRLPPWLHVDIPLSMRRATFRDVPLLRMQHVRATQTSAPFELPEERIEITLIDSGMYDPLNDTIMLRVAASSIGAFTIQEPRTSVAFIGAHGDPLRYPGVICSREGQELVVGSSAPVLLTELR
ncbi:MAG TPA: hypothetical protein VGQ36_28540 [Thermoanaerobaculia bacterium]|nr:hypothetical protein [Thermoanaerobaculia bacterium]